jgi:hypothetical protein
MNRLFAGLAIALTLSSTAFAADPAPARPVHRATRTPVVRERQVNQAARIRQGEKSGALTPTEAAKLRGEEKLVREQKRAAKADGVVTPAERAQLHQAQDDVSKDIHAEKHDGEVK